MSLDDHGYNLPLEGETRKQKVTRLIRFWFVAGVIVGACSAAIFIQQGV